MSRPNKSKPRLAARLGAVQASYQREMEGTPIATLLTEFHNHRLGATIGDAKYYGAEIAFFDDLVSGSDARRLELDRAITARLVEGWNFERLDRLMRALLRVATYELLARPDVSAQTIITEYVGIADAFYAKREKAFVNGLLDAVAKDVRSAKAAQADR